jgi:hypothetical protein
MMAYAHDGFRGLALNLLFEIANVEWRGLKLSNSLVPAPAGLEVLSSSLPLSFYYHCLNRDERDSYGGPHSVPG